MPHPQPLGSCPSLFFVFPTELRPVASDIPARYDSLGVGVCNLVLVSRGEYGNVIFVAGDDVFRIIAVMGNFPYDDLSRVLQKNTGEGWHVLMPSLASLIASPKPAVLPTASIGLQRFACY